MSSDTPARLLVWLCLSVSLLFTCTAHAELLLEPSSSGTLLGKHITILEDPGGTLTPMESLRIQRTGQFQTPEADHPSFGYTGSVFWTHIVFQQTGKVAETWYLELDTPLLGEVDLYVIERDDIRIQTRTGSNRKFAQRPIEHRSFLFPFTLEPGERVEFMLRTVAQTSHQLALNIWQADEFWTKEQSRYAMLGVFFGMMVVMIIFNSFIYLSLRDPSYLPYVCFVCFITVFLASLDGLSTQFLWPNSAWWNRAFIAALVPATSCSALIFTDRFLELEGRRPGARALLNINVRILILLVIAAFFLPYGTVIRPAIVFSVTATIICTVLGVTEWLNGSRAAKFYTLAWVAPMVGSSLLAFSKLGYLEHSLATSYGLHVGAAIEVTLFSIALAARMQAVRDDTIRAELETTQLREQLNTQMQAKVELFTKIASDLQSPLGAILKHLDSYRSQLTEATVVTDSIFSDMTEDTLVRDMRGRVLDNTQNQHFQLMGIEHDAKRLADVVKDMQALSDSNTNKQETHSLLLRDLLETSLERVRSSLGDNLFETIEITDDIQQAEPPPSVEGNPFILVDALKCILMQSIRQATNAKMPELRIHHQRAGEFYLISFINNGGAMMASDVEELFKLELTPGTRSRDLAVIRSVLRQEGGDLTLLSSGQHGTQAAFELRLPIHVKVRQSVALMDAQA